MSVWVQRAIGEKLAALRGGETRRDFAARTGFNRLVYGRIESGQQNLTIATLLSLAAPHGITLAALLEGAEARAAELEAAGGDADAAA